MSSVAYGTIRMASVSRNNNVPTGKTELREGVAAKRRDRQSDRDRKERT